MLDSLELRYTAQLITTPFNYVFLLVEENESSTAVTGNPHAPYFNSLLAQYSSSGSYYASTHPSIGNYFMLTTGQVVTNDDHYSGTVNVDNIVRHLNATTLTWKSYAESIPSAGYLGGNTGLYIQHHNPFSYLTDVTTNRSQAANLVPFSQLASDLKTHQLPNYALIIPNMVDDGHSCAASKPTCSDSDRVANLDAWLQQNIPPLISDRDFSATGLLIITFDEGSRTDNAHGGGQVPWLAISAASKIGFIGKAPVLQHQNTLRLMGTSLGLTSLPGAANSGPDMHQFFN